MCVCVGGGGGLPLSKDSEKTYFDHILFEDYLNEYCKFSGVSEVSQHAV